MGQPRRGGLRPPHASNPKPCSHKDTKEMTPEVLRKPGCVPGIPLLTSPPHPVMIDLVLPSHGRPVGIERRYERLPIEIERRGGGVVCTLDFLPSPLRWCGMAESASPNLWDAAKQAYERKDYDAEVILRRQLCEQFPDDMNCLHNLGLALLNQGRVDDAISTFEQVLSRDPMVSCQYNNLANALLQKGVDLQHLVQIFHAALLASESYDDIIRHFVNLCVSAALG